MSLIDITKTDLFFAHLPEFKNIISRNQGLIHFNPPYNDFEFAYGFLTVLGETVAYNEGELETFTQDFIRLFSNDTLEHVQYVVKLSSTIHGNKVTITIKHKLSKADLAFSRDYIINKIVNQNKDFDDDYQCVNNLDIGVKVEYRLTPDNKETVVESYRRFLPPVKLEKTKHHKSLIIDNEIYSILNQLNLPHIRVATLPYRNNFDVGGDLLNFFNIRRLSSILSWNDVSMDKIRTALRFCELLYLNGQVYNFNDYKIMPIITLGCEGDNIYLIDSTVKRKQYLFKVDNRELDWEIKLRNNLIDYFRRQFVFARYGVKEALGAGINEDRYSTDVSKCDKVERLRYLAHLINVDIKMRLTSAFNRYFPKDYSVVVDNFTGKHSEVDIHFSTNEIHILYPNLLKGKIQDPLIDSFKVDISKAVHLLDVLYGLTDYNQFTDPATVKSFNIVMYEEYQIELESIYRKVYDKLKQEETLIPENRRSVNLVYGILREALVDVAENKLPHLQLIGESVCYKKGEEILLIITPALTEVRSDDSPSRMNMDPRYDVAIISSPTKMRSRLNLNEVCRYFLDYVLDK